MGNPVAKLIDMVQLIENVLVVNAEYRSGFWLGWKNGQQFLAGCSILRTGIHIFPYAELHLRHQFGLVKNLLYLQCLFPVTSGEIQVIGFRISYSKIAQSVDKVPFLLVEFIRVVDDPPDVEVDDGLAAGGGFEEGEVL